MACSCGKTGNYTFTQIVQRDGSSLPTLKYLHCKYKDQFEALFAQQGINATEGNLPSLSQAADQGLDKSGAIKDAKGNPIFFSVEDTLRKIDVSKVSNNTCAV